MGISDAAEGALGIEGDVRARGVARGGTREVGAAVTLGIGDEEGVGDADGLSRGVKLG